MENKIDASKVIEKAKSDYKEFDETHLLREKERLLSRVGVLPENSSDASKEQIEDVSTYAAVLEVLEERSKEARSNQIFSKMQTHIITISTMTLALCAVVMLLIEGITK